MADHGRTLVPIPAYLADTRGLYESGEQFSLPTLTNALRKFKARLRALASALVSNLKDLLLVLSESFFVLSIFLLVFGMPAWITGIGFILLTVTILFSERGSPT